jgi:enoyl-CoA hydratase/carnithine racemase
MTTTVATPAPQGTVRLTIDGAAAHVLFDRPEAHNALTWTMYEQLGEICTRLASDPSVRVVTLRGAGGKAFVAGTDIAQFAAFGSGEDGAEDGVAYERNIDAGVDALERLPMPVIALLEGWVVGGGLAIAATADLRIATPDARFGVPIARTLGNCLSSTNVSRLVAGFGAGNAKRMLLLADLLTAEEARATGFVTQVVAADALEAASAAMCARLAGHAPLTLRAAKETVRRIVAAGVPDNLDLVRLCYGSADFREGIAAFVEKRPARWQGR